MFGMLGDAHGPASPSTPTRRHVLPPRSRELAAVKLLCIERTSTATAHPWQEKQGPHFHLEARSEQRAPAADTKTGMTLSKMQPQKEPRRGNLQARA